MSGYTVEVTRPDMSGFWLVHIVELGKYTQAPSLAAVESMAADLITVLGAGAGDLDVRIILPDDVQKCLDLAAELTTESARLQTRAAVLRRSAARGLRQRGLAVRDIGDALGISSARAQQLSTQNITQVGVDDTA